MKARGGTSARPTTTALKFYAGAAFGIGLSLGSVLVWTGFARIVGIAPAFALVTVIRLLFRGPIDTRFSIWTAALGLLLDRLLCLLLPPRESSLIVPDQCDGCRKHQTETEAAIAALPLAEGWPVEGPV
jgi:hypothetical protein